MNGIIKIGFITMGIPKIKGSLILKIPQGRASLAMALKSSLLENRKIAISSPPVIPLPVSEKNVLQNGEQTMLGAASPAA